VKASAFGTFPRKKEDRQGKKHRYGSISSMGISPQEKLIIGEVKILNNIHTEQITTLSRVHFLCSEEERPWSGSITNY